MIIRQNWTKWPSQRIPANVIYLKTVDYSEQLLAFVDDQCLAWLYTKTLFVVLLCVLLLVCQVSKYLSKILAVESLILPSEVVWCLNFYFVFASWGYRSNTTRVPTKHLHHPVITRILQNSIDGWFDWAACTCRTNHFAQYYRWRWMFEWGLGHDFKHRVETFIFQGAL